jgi:hypothetical protein
MAFCLVFCATSCSLLQDHPEETTPTPVVTAEPLGPKAAAYLMEKYSKTFTVKNDLGEIVECSLDNENETVTVYSAPYLIRSTHALHSLYAGDFVDNGYLVFNQDKLVSQFDVLVGDSFHTTLVSYSLPVLPSAITLNTSADDVAALTKHAHFVITVMSTSPTSTTSAISIPDSVKSRMEQLGYPLEMRLVYPMPGANFTALHEMSYSQLSAFIDRECTSVDTVITNPSSYDMTAEEYLEKKYGYDFVKKSTLEGLVDGVETFTAAGIDGYITVLSRDAMGDLGADSGLFSDAYFDDGYSVINAAKMQEEIRQYFGLEYGTSRLIVDFKTKILPSAVTADMTLSEIQQQYPEYAVYDITVLASQIPHPGDFQTTLNRMRADKVQAYVMVKEVPAAMQEKLTKITISQLETALYDTTHNAAVPSVGF